MPFNVALSRKWLITITQTASLLLILSLRDEIHVCVNDTNNDDISCYQITRLGLYFHNTVETLRYLTMGPEGGLSQGAQKLGCAAQCAE
jgi:hypothetical protein